MKIGVVLMLIVPISLLASCAQNEPERVVVGPKGSDETFIPWGAPRSGDPQGGGPLGGMLSEER